MQARRQEGVKFPEIPQYTFPLAIRVSAATATDDKLQDCNFNWSLAKIRQYRINPAGRDALAQLYQWAARAYPARLQTL